jgi:hypothetical protein
MRLPRIEPPGPLDADNPWSKEAEAEISAALNALLADLFTLDLKTKISAGMCLGHISQSITRCLTNRPIKFSAPWI